MKKIIQLFALLFLYSITAYAQVCKIVTDEKNDAPMIVGVCDRAALEDTVFSWWYETEYETYQLDTTTLNIAKEHLDDISITLVFGSWCGDSRREVPRFLKILDYLEFPMDKLSIIAVDRTKTTEYYDVKPLNIEYVPTMIIYKHEDEWGRIIETPIETLEKDFKNILN